MSAANLSVLDLVREGDDSLVTVHVANVSDRFFSPLLAAKLMIDVRGLVHQSCYSKPDPSEGLHAKAGQPRGSRRWAFAQEIFSNQGRGTESGHFLEHLVLEMALSVTRPGRARRFSGETTWNWREEPDRFRLRFFHMDEKVLRSALSLSAKALAHHDYIIDVGDTDSERRVITAREPVAALRIA